MSRSLDFTRGDGVTKERAAALKAARATEEGLAQYMSSCAFKGKDAAFLANAPHVTMHTLIDYCGDTERSDGVALIRAQNWSCENWHEYQLMLEAATGLGKDLALLSERYAQRRKEEKAIVNTGMTPTIAKELTIWRAAYKHLQGYETAGRALQAALKRETTARLELMKQCRQNVVGPWRAYFELEQSPLNLEATPDETAAVFNLTKTGKESRTSAEYRFTDKWQLERKKKLVEMALKLSRGKTLPQAPPIWVDPHLQTGELEELVGPRNVLPLAYRDMLPLVPPIEFYSAVNAAEMNKKKRTVPPPTGNSSNEQKDEDEDDWEGTPAS